MLFRSEQCDIEPPPQPQEITAYTITDPVKLRQEIDKVETQGYAISDHESVIGCRCVAVPIRSSLEKVVAAVSISAPSSRLPDASMPGVLAKLLDAAGRIERVL